ncbi:MAG TPA: glutathione S-transferase family protein [Polyangia bacterium]|nr:glutathione S-transferase family protein [Polyangia bacterium]
MGTIEGYEPSFDQNAEARAEAAPALKLYGTTTSPYTRKVRILGRAAGYAVALVDTRTEEGAAALARLAPLGKVPVAELPGAPSPVVLPDSGLIAAWLWERHAAAMRAAGFAAPAVGSAADWAERELVLVVEGALDAAINRFYLLRDQLPDQGYVTRQRDRVSTTLAWLDARMPAFARPLSPAALSLGCALDWMVFRDVTDLVRFPRLVTFREAWKASGVGAGTEPA